MGVTSWSAAQSNPTLGDWWELRASHDANRFYVTDMTSSTYPYGQIHVYYSDTDDPSATWSSATVPTMNYWANNLVVSGGSALGMATYTGTQFVDRVAGVLYATTPSSWTFGTIVAGGTANNYFTTGLAYGGGTWVAVGSRDFYGGTAAATAWLAYSTALSGTWTLVHDFTAGGMFGAENVAYGGGTFVAIGHAGTAGGDYYRPVVYTSTDPSGTWGSATGLPAFFDTRAWKNFCYINGYFVSPTYSGGTAYPVTAENIVLYSDAPASSWALVRESSLGPSRTAGDRLQDITSIGSSWVLAVSSKPPGTGGASVYYLDSASPSGTYTAVTDTDVSGLYAAGIDGNTTTGVLAVWYGTSSLFAPGIALARYLRQRQSPVRTPSRVRSPQLRQRQRPETT